MRQASESQRRNGLPCCGLREAISQQACIGGGRQALTDRYGGEIAEESESVNSDVIRETIMVEA
jgi:hypothetical protein